MNHITGMKRRTALFKPASLVCGLGVIISPALRAADDPSAELAKQLSNPVASLISVPFQGNADFGIGPNEATRFTLNVQPVIPLAITDDWNLIIRTIIPIVDAESPAAGVDDAAGLGDVLQSFFFSPKAPTADGWILGAGPVLLYPSATDDLLGAEQWAAGPTGLVLRQQNGWTYGALANHLWSYAGDGSRAEVNATFLQPFVSFTTKRQTTLGLNAESSYNWDACQWTVPVNLTVSQLVKIGGQPVQFFGGVRYYLDAPDGGPEWGLRFGVTFLFPKS